MFTTTMAALTETPAIAPTAAGWGISTRGMDPLAEAVSAGSVSLRSGLTVWDRAGAGHWSAAVVTSMVPIMPRSSWSRMWQW